MRPAVSNTTRDHAEWSAGNPHLATIARLQAEIARVIDRVAPATPKFALLDFPCHDNVGDSAIWLGEIAFFRDHRGAVPSFVTSVDFDRFDELERRVPRGTIYIHGGGNFGDLYPWNQEFRERVLARFPGRRVVQLPQTVHFESSDNLQRAAEAIRRHGNFVLLVRDRVSYAIASEAFDCEIELCPDMAFTLGPLKRTPPTRELLLLLRKDRERNLNTPPDGDATPQWPVVDWPILSESFDTRFKLKTLVRSVVQTPRTILEPHRLREIYYRRMAEHRLQVGIDLLASGSALITDRLHGHILALLLGIPHRTTDNTYGKVGNFIAAWTRDAAQVAAASPLERAYAALVPPETTPAHAEHLQRYGT